MEPAVERTAVEVFALDWHDMNLIAVLDMADNWIRNEIFLVFWTKVVIAAILHDALEKFWRHDVFADINEVAWRIFALWLLGLPFVCFFG